VAGDDAFLVRWKHPDGQPRPFTVNSSLAQSVRLFVNDSAQPRAAGNDLSSGFRVALADPACEDDPVQASKPRGQRTNLANDAVDE